MMLLKPISMMRAATGGGGGASGNFTFSFVQKATMGTGYAVATNPTVTFGSAITAGNLLLCAAAERGGGVPADHAITDNNGKTWNRVSALNIDNSVGGDEGNTRMSMSVWWREVDSSGETDTTPTITLTDGTAGLMAVEIAPSAAYNWAVSGTAVNGSGAASLDGINSGNASPSGDDILVLGVWVSRVGSPQLSVFGITEYGTDIEFASGDVNSLSFCIGMETTSQADSSTYSSTADLGSDTTSEGAIATLCFHDV